MASSSRAFVLRHTRLGPVAGLDGIRLNLADEILPLWGATQIETTDPDAPLPYWAFAWAGGLGIARYLLDHPEAVTDRRVMDIGSGSGLCAIVAKQTGASAVTAIDIDAFAAAAIRLNARANGQRVAITQRDILDEGPPDDVDVVLAGDCLYDAALADRILPWLARAHERGIDVLLGDPGRRYLPTDGLIELASYQVRTTTELEDLDLKVGRVLTFPPLSRPAPDR